MTPTQIHLHHHIYGAIAKHGPTDLNYNLGDDLEQACPVFADKDLIAVVPSDETDVSDEINEAMMGLYRENLIGGFNFDGDDPPGVSQFGPTHSGVLLYLWGRGVRSGDLSKIHSDPRSLPEHLPPIVETIAIKPWYDSKFENLLG